MKKLPLVATSVLAALPILVTCGDNGSSIGDNGGRAGAVSSAGTSGNSSAGASSGGSPAAGGSGSSGNGGSVAFGPAGSSGMSGAAGGSGGSAPSTEKFSFFVTSLKAMVELSGNKDGFGGDLRFGETGDGAGLKGADKICTTIAEKSMPGNNKTWRAFLSVTKGTDGKPVDAIDRIGKGPWYDRVGRLVSMNITSLAKERPEGADEAIVDDLPNEDGVPNHEPDIGAGEVDNHDVLTGTGEDGRLFSSEGDFNCNDWTSSAESGSPHCGHSWPRGGFLPQGGPGEQVGPIGSGENWMSDLDEAGCAPGVFIVENGPPGANGTKTVGDGGGYGGIYCFALSP